LIVKWLLSIGFDREAIASLESQHSNRLPVYDDRQRSLDGTVKRAYRLADGQLIEAVLMPYEDGRRTACIR
jgi:adenine C2-methylase RlmN of 23S rRNA A2503 and tRNA A37